MLWLSHNPFHALYNLDVRPVSLYHDHGLFHVHVLIHDHVDDPFLDRVLFQIVFYYLWFHLNHVLYLDLDDNLYYQLILLPTTAATRKQY